MVNRLPVDLACAGMGCNGARDLVWLSRVGGRMDNAGADRLDYRPGIEVAVDAVGILVE